MANLIRRLVSQHKKRFQNDEFDLDLTYITPRVIAMSWPGDGGEAIYRNPMSEVARMLNKYHADHYKVYNLCSEKSYDPSRFSDGLHAAFPFDDHQVPPLPMLFSFIRDATVYLEANKCNVAVVHCKAGKGRTGICIAALLLSMGTAHTWSAALAQFAIMRTSNCVGVTIASQRRWVQYFEAIKDQSDAPAPCPIILTSIRVSDLPAKYAGRVVVVLQQRAYSKDEGYHNVTLLAANMPPLATSSSMFGSFMCGLQSCGVPSDTLALPAPDKSSEDSGLSQEERVHVGAGWRMRLTENGDVIVDLDGGEDANMWQLRGDFKIQVFLDNISRSRSLFWCWHNSSFMTGTHCTLTRESLDKVHRAMPQLVSMTLQWKPGDASMFPLQGALVTPKPADEEGNILDTPQWIHDEGTLAAGNESTIERIEFPAHTLNASNRRHSLKNYSTESSPLASWFNLQGPPQHTDRDSAPKRNLQRRHTDAQTIDLSLLDRLDGAWMGSSAATDRPRRTAPADATVNVTLGSSLVHAPLHKTSAFRQTAKASHLSRRSATSADPALRRGFQTVGNRSLRLFSTVEYEPLGDHSCTTDPLSANIGGGHSHLSHATAPPDVRDNMGATGHHSESLSAMSMHSAMGRTTSQQSVPGCAHQATPKRASLPPECRLRDNFGHGAAALRSRPTAAAAAATPPPNPTGGGSSFMDGSRSAKSLSPAVENDGMDDEAMRVPDAPREYMNRLMRQHQRAVQARGSRGSQPFACQQAQRPAAVSRDTSLGKSSREAASNGNLTRPTSTESFSRSSSSDSTTTLQQTTFESDASAALRLGGTSDLTCKPPPRRDSSAPYWPSAVAQPVAIPHADCMSPFFTADGTGFSGALEESLFIRSVGH